MKHTAVPEPTGWTQLPKQEKILYVQALWDHIAEDPSEVPVLESQLRLAKERLEAYRRDPSQATCARQMLQDVADGKI